MKKVTKVVIAVLILIVWILAIIPFIRNSEKLELNAASQNKLSGSFVTLSSGKTHYQLDGAAKGKVVILIHGFSVPMYLYDSTFHVLTHAGFRVLRFDLLGRGYSARPKTKYDLGLFVQQTKEIIDSLHLSTPVDLVGTSMGGTIVAGFTNSYPALVRKVVLIDPHAVKKDITPINIPILGDYYAAAFWMKTLPQSQLSDFYRPERHPDWAGRYMEQMQYKGFRRAIVSTARNILHRDFLTTYQKLRDFPVLLIWGTSDQTIPKTEIDTLRKLIHPEFLPVNKAGHLPLLEQSVVVNKRLIAFLK
jgi:pimeloyl-ACP methyl ester carboxylesterase